jgi:hypothetical protein
MEIVVPSPAYSTAAAFIPKVLLVALADLP